MSPRVPGGLKREQGGRERKREKDRDRDREKEKEKEKELNRNYHFHFLNVTQRSLVIYPKPHRSGIDIRLAWFPVPSLHGAG